ncbi:MAG: oligosaccharide flippase family protein [Pseudomonadota bacterium]
MSKDVAVAAGRGVLYIAVAKLYFMVAGYAIYFALPRLLGTEADWGNYLLVVGLVSVIDNFIVTGTIQGVSRFTAQAEGRADAVRRAALRVQLFLGGGVALLYFLAAPLLAQWEKDAGLTGLYRLSAGIVFFYAFYAVFVGSANGQRHFGKQASLDISFATLRAIAILGFVAMGWGTLGAIGGFVSAAGLILIVSVFWVGLPKKQDRFEARKILRFTSELFVYTFILNMIMRVDLFLLKRLAVAFVEGVGVDAAKVASTYAAYYGTAQSLAFIPYQAILAVAFVIFPLISRSTFKNDQNETRAYICQTLRLSLVFVAGVAVVFMAKPEAIIRLLYPSQYALGGSALRVLAAGMVSFSVFTIINTILNASGRTWQTIACGALTLVCASTANSLLIPRANSLLDALNLAAWSTAGSITLGLLFSVFLVYRAFGAAFVPLSLLRVVVAMAVAMIVGHFFPDGSKLATLAIAVVVFVVYFLVLIMLKEFDANDFAKIKRVVRRGK